MWQSVSEGELGYGPYAFGPAVVTVEVAAFAVVELCAKHHSRCHVPEYVDVAAESIAVFIGIDCLCR